jgi:TPR repeat protein
MGIGEAACQNAAAHRLYKTGDYSAAARLLEPCAKDGDARAQLRLATLYRMGQGVEEDEYAAFRWYQAAADQGVPEAQFHVGLMYLRGEGVTEDSDAALDWLETASRAGYGDAVTLFDYVLNNDTATAC